MGTEGAEILTNGAEVIRRHTFENGEAVVLARVPGVHPYVTWWANAEGETFWGHYFLPNEFEEAEADFDARVARG